MKKKKNKSNKKGLSMVSIESLCSDDIDYLFGWMEGERADKIRVLRKLEISKGAVVTNSRYNNSFKNGLDYLNAEIKFYENAGLDLGKGDAEFGYKMPLPKPGENYRELMVFRRRD